MQTEPAPVMTIGELSRYLRVPKSTLYRLAQEGRVPRQKVGRHWRFRKEAIDRWLEESANSARQAEAERDAGASR